MFQSVKYLHANDFELGNLSKEAEVVAHLAIIAPVKQRQEDCNVSAGQFTLFGKHLANKRSCVIKIRWISPQE